MNINLYQFGKRVNSLKVPSQEGLALSVVLKEDTSIYNPTFILNYNPFDYNYLKWDDRYYYIVDKVYRNNSIFEISCQIDVLATYRSDILNTSSYVQYSSSNYDIGITDSRLSTKDEVSISASQSTLLTDGNVAGTYILNYATSSATWGPTGCVWLSRTQSVNLANELNSTGFNEFLENFQKQFTGAYDSLISCRYVPFLWAGGGSAEVVLGGYQTGIIGQLIVPDVRYSVEVTIPWQFNDFRNQAPFTSILLYLPAYGYLEINPDDYIGKTSIRIDLVIDGATGEGTYIIGNIARCSTMFSAPVPVGTVSTNNMGFVGGLISAGISASTGNVIGTISSIEGIVASQARNVGNVGSLGGGSGILASPVPWQNVVCISISHDTNQEPNSLLSVQGRPCLKVLSLSSLTGYCQTINASVSVNASNNIIEEINNLLNGGIYIE